MPGSVASARAVGRADRILELVATAGTPPSVTAVARELDLPLSSTADLLRELRATGWLRLRGRGHVLGRRPYVLGLLAGVGPPASLTHTELDALSRLARAPVALAVLVGGQVRYVDHAGPRAPDRLQRVTDDHRPRPPLRTAAGRLLLALGDPEESARALAGVDDPPAVAAYLTERPEIVRTRLARSDGLADPAIRAVAVPVEEDGETVAAAVLIGTRRGRADRSVTLDRAAARLVAALADRGARESHVGPWPESPPR